MVNARTLGLGIALAATTALAVATATPAHATATFAANASALLTITNITGANPGGDLLLDGGAIVFDSGASFTGALGTVASAFGDADFNPSDPTSLNQQANATGTAEPSGVPGSEASAFYLTDGFLEIENTSTSDTYLIDFTLDWGVSASATFEKGEDKEDAFAEAIIDLSGDYDFDALADADTLFDDAGEAVGGVESFSLTLAPGDFAELFLRVDAQGEAFSVPVAGALPLMLAGLLGFGVVARRRG